MSKLKGGLLVGLLAVSLAATSCLSVATPGHLVFCYNGKLYHRWTPLYLNGTGNYTVWLVNIAPDAKPIEHVWIWVYSPDVRVLGVTYDGVFRPSNAGWSVGISLVRPHMGTPDFIKGGVVGYTACWLGVEYFEPNPYTDYQLHISVLKPGTYTVHVEYVEHGVKHDTVLTLVVPPS